MLRPSRVAILSVGHSSAALFGSFSGRFMLKSSLVVDWSFFESCHGKCYCDPEGGTLKNAARHHELRGDLKDFIKDAALLYEWACSKSGLATPKKKLAEKKGRGIYRRYFYYIPSKGTGAVDRSRLHIVAPPLQENLTALLCALRRPAAAPQRRLAARSRGCAG